MVDELKRSISFCLLYLEATDTTSNGTEDIEKNRALVNVVPFSTCFISVTLFTMSANMPWSF